MKYCSKCGNELMDDAIVCVKCGCIVEQPQNTAAKNKNDKEKSARKESKDNHLWILMALGIMLCSVTLAEMSRFGFRMILSLSLQLLATVICSAFVITMSIRYIIKSENKVLPVLGIVFGSVTFLLAIVIYISYFRYSYF